MNLVLPFANYARYYYYYTTVRLFYTNTNKMFLQNRNVMREYVYVLIFTDRKA